MTGRDVVLYCKTTARDCASNLKWRKVVDGPWDNAQGFCKPTGRQGKGTMLARLPAASGQSNYPEYR